LGQPVIVDNRNAVISAETAAKAAPDGYTLLISGGSLWLLPFLRDNVSWDPIKDFSPVSLLATSPNMIVVHPSVAAKSVSELIILAKARSGELNYGASVGGSTHLAAELFKAMAGVNLVRVPFKGNGPALNALITGEVQVMFATVTAALPHVKSGRLRALASTSAQPSALLPDLPTAAATLPGYASATLIGIFAPPKTPMAIVNRLNQEIVAAFAAPDLKKRFFDAGVETVANSPAEFAATIKSDMSRMGKVIRDAGIKAE
jgi:tripartite-type tricarboxylate transporter receptor subunit TctC